MLSSNRVLLSLALASSALLSLPISSAQNAESQQSTPVSASQRVRSFGVKYLGSFERVSPDEIESRLKNKGLLPLIERPYEAECQLLVTSLCLTRSRSETASPLTQAGPHDSALQSSC
jgi:hypothetical protein